MNKRYEIGVIGGGVAVEMAFPALQRYEDVAISYLDSANSSLFENFTYFEKTTELIDPRKISALYIAVPVHKHKPFLIEAAKHGIPTLVEKPLCLSVEECESLANFDTSKIAVAFRKRFSIAAAAIKRAHQTQQNDPAEIEYIWLAPHPGTNHWKRKRQFAGGGVVMDIGSHILDLFEHCIGGIHELSVGEFSFDLDEETENFVQLTCHLGANTLGRVMIGWASASSYQLFRYRNSKTMVSWTKLGGTRESSLTVVDGSHCHTVRCDRKNDYIAMFKEFDLFCADQPNSIPTFASGVGNMRRIESVYEAISARHDSHSF